MDENCKDCVQVANLIDKIKSLWHAANEIKEQNKDFEKRITELEITRGETKEQLNSINNFLERIEKSIEALTKEVADLKNKPASNFEKFKLAVITSVCSGAVGTFLGFIFTKK